MSFNDDCYDLMGDIKKLPAKDSKEIKKSLKKVMDKVSEIEADNESMSKQLMISNQNISSMVNMIDYLVDNKIITKEQAIDARVKSNRPTWFSHD